MIEGLSHLTFIVKDLERSGEFFKRLFEAVEIYSSQEHNFSLSRERFFLINTLWVVIMEGDSLADRTYNHIAFKIDEKDFDKYAEKIEEMRLEVKPPRPRVEGEGRSLYFYDYDNHLFELHTGTLSDRLTRYSLSLPGCE